MAVILEERPAQAATGERPMTATMNRMIRLLKTVRPGSDAEALRMLRGAFPDSTLAQRIAAVASHAH
jgi:hypothetical protein